MSFDMPLDDDDRGDPHGECRHEIHRLQERLAAIGNALSEIVVTDNRNHGEMRYVPTGEELLRIWEMAKS